MKMKSILFPSKRRETDSGKQYGGDCSDEQKEQHDFAGVECADVPDQPDQSERGALNKNEECGSACGPAKFGIGKIPQGRNLSISQRNQNQHDSSEDDQNQNGFQPSIDLE